MKEVTIYTDGSAHGNPGPGGWAARLTTANAKGKTVACDIYGGGGENTTNNQMELTAAIEGLSALTEPCKVTVVADSLYVVNPFAKNWIEDWRRKGWKNSKKKPVANRELWERLDALVQTHEVTFEHVDGHAGVYDNEIVDTNANIGADTQCEPVKTYTAL